MSSIPREDMLRAGDGAMAAVRRSLRRVLDFLKQLCGSALDHEEEVTALADRGSFQDINPSGDILAPDVDRSDNDNIVKVNVGDSHGYVKAVVCTFSDSREGIGA